MKTNLIKIGNSLGIRIPKPFLKDLGIFDTVEIIVKNKLLIIRPFPKKPREGWEESFQEMALNQDDIIPDSLLNISNKFDEEEWEW